MYKLHKLLLALSATSLITGCSVWGGNSFQCPGAGTEGATCMSARQVYEATHTSDRVAPNYRDGKPINTRPKGDSSADEVGSPDSPARASLGHSHAVGAHHATLNTYVPPLPDADSPLPVRTPARVMRIRIFPWEDGQRDLNTGGFVFTEIEGRQWTLGDDQVSRVQPNVITPLAMPKGSRPAGATTPLMPPGQSRPDAGAVPPSQRQAPPPSPAPTTLRTP